MTPLLTVIIPFKNEGIEVFNTLNSIKETSECLIDIILVNDGSDDGYDSQTIASHFNANYIVHELSKGVAASREDGISACKTEYFIFLDAHMRSFTQNWDTLILNELRKDHRAIYCALTTALDRDGQPMNVNHCGLGVTLNIDDLSYTWNTIDLDPNNSVCEIGCVMGASYSSNLSYWKKLQGLKGLRGYGYDEQFISLKAFMEGGCSKVIKTTIFGHIFRSYNEVPYMMNSSNFVFNQLYIAELLLPQKKKIAFFRNIKSLCDADVFNKSISEIQVLRKEIKDIKNYYNSIFTRTYEDYENENLKYK